jgi:hypothetical protein
MAAEVGNQRPSSGLAILGYCYHPSSIGLISRQLTTIQYLLGRFPTNVTLILTLFLGLASASASQTHKNFLCPEASQRCGIGTGSFPSGWINLPWHSADVFSI